MDEIQKKVLAAFQKEHKNHLTTIRGFLAAQKTGKHHSGTDMLDLKRCAHTLKGAARAAGLDFVQEAALGLEKLFGRMDGSDLGDDISDAIHRILDGIEAYVANVATDPESKPPEDLIAVLNNCLQGKSPKKAPIVQATKPFAEKELETPALPAFANENDIKAKVFRAFQHEYRTHLEVIRRILDTMPPDSLPAQEEINRAFRSAHTLKGAARAADIPAVQKIAHTIENLFSGIRDNQKPAGADLIRKIAQGLDAIEDHVASLSRSGEPAVQSVAMKTSPSPESKEQERPVLQKKQVHEAAEIPEQHLSEDNNATIHINAERLDQLQRTAEEILSQGLQQQLVAQGIKALKTRISSMVKNSVYHWEILHRTLERIENQAVAETILDCFREQKQLLPKLAAEIRELGRLHSSSWRMNTGLIRQIRSDVLSTRMVPAEDIFQFFRKMVRDMAADEGKQVNFKIKGLEVKADRLVLQMLKDPLMHMLRNAVSHGIELPEARESAGKEPTGTIHFFIKVDRNRLRITVEDDGKGLDFGRISDLAFKKGYLSREDIKTVSHEELLHYIYQPGFTTVKMITDLQGRGIGMSVAQEAVKRLRGEINVKTRENKGTRFVLLIPLILSTHRVLLVQAGGQTFGIPLESIDRLIKIRLSRIFTLEGKPVINYDKRPIPFAGLSDLLALGRAPFPKDNELISVAVLHAGSDMMALTLDAVLSEEEIQIKDLPAPADRASHFTGGFIRGDGCVSLIVNPAVLMDTLLRSSGDNLSFFNTAEVPVQQEKRKILIVDDSVTTRTLEKTILESQGYEVYMAVDGLDALDLMETTDIDLVVADIQMPKMDGFTLIEEMKKSERLKEMPVIIVSSMADQQDMARGLELGADAYIIKQKFDQKNLLEAIGQIL